MGEASRLAQADRKPDPTRPAEVCRHKESAVKEYKLVIDINPNFCLNVAIVACLFGTFIPTIWVKVVSALVAFVMILIVVLITAIDFFGVDDEN
jgi:hypothetical protein